jgi:hypothetical protein
MAQHPMETTLRTALWRQFGAAIEMLENALLACPSTQWNGLLWSDPETPAYPTFWSLTHHTLFWLDLYLTGSLEAFAPPTPFTQDESGPARVLPEHAAQLSLFLGQHGIPGEALDWVGQAKDEAGL